MTLFFETLAQVAEYVSLICEVDFESLGRRLTFFVILGYIIFVFGNIRKTHNSLGEPKNLFKYFRLL